MHTAVERVIRSFSHKQPVQDAASSEDRHGEQQHATQFAAQFLENYRDQLAQRSRIAGTSRQG